MKSKTTLTIETKRDNLNKVISNLLFIISNLNRNAFYKSVDAWELKEVLEKSTKWRNTLNNYQKVYNKSSTLKNNVD